MTIDRNFGGVIWTNHALARLTERGIKQGDAWATFRNPEESRYAKAKGAWIYYRIYGSQKIEVVAKKNERSEWVILSVWSKTVNENSAKKKIEPLWKVIFKRLFKAN
jgi:hypothetical protein